MRFPVYVALAVLIGALAGAGCDEPLSDLTGPTPNLEPTFSSIVNDIFNATDSSGRFACTSCHTTAGGRNPPQGLSLEPAVAYNNLVSVPSRQKPTLMRVVPGDPDASYLIHKLEGRADIVGTPMPRGDVRLTEGQILVIKRWIALGARND
jgi:hypothetical protein